MRLNSFFLQVWACLILPTSSVVCDFSTSKPITSQEDANILLKDCITVTGEFDVVREYKGSLVISGVTKLRGNFNVYAKEITNIVWSDLEYIDNLEVRNTTALRSISFPKLSTANFITIRYVQRLDIDFPSLTYARNIMLDGQIASLNAPLLFNVSSIRVGHELSYLENKTAIDGFNFSLPSLEYVSDYLWLMANFTDFVLPKLKVISILTKRQVGYPYIPYLPFDNLSEIDLDPVRNISLPSLVNAGKLSINCHRSISLPSLEQVLDLTLDIANSTAVIFPALWNATALRINGQVTDASFPALNETELIKIAGTGPLETNCTTVTADWKRTNTTETYTKYQTCMSKPGMSYCRAFSCNWSDPKPIKHKKKKSLSGDEIAGICAGVVFGFIFMGLAYLWLTKRRQKRKVVAAAEQREREIEMDGVTIMGDRESGERVEPASVVDGRRGSKDTVVVVGVDERDGQRS